MNARFLPPSVRKDAQPACQPLDDAIPAREVPADLACCCPARATVRVTLPPTQARAHETDLLMCGHHYRASRTALAAARAVVRALPGTSHDIAAWIGAPRDLPAFRPGQLTIMMSGGAQQRGGRHVSEAHRGRYGRF